MGEVNKTKTLKNSGSSYTEFYYHFFRNILIIALPILFISAIILSSLHSSATDSGSGTDSLTISISSACTLSSVVNTEHSDNVKAGTYKDNIGKTTIKTTCNDNNGYSIYANGYSNNEEGNNKLVNTLSPSNVIGTGLNTSGDTSSWAMKLNNMPDDPSPTPPVIESAYDDTYGLIPSNWTKVLSLPSGSTDMSLGSSFTTTYAVYANSRQYTGTYQGQVKYVLTHPNSNSQHLFMQDVDTWGNSVLANIGDSIQVIDQRDGKSYWVTRLADGHIWMTQNLDLDLDPAKSLTSNDTDLTDHSLVGAYADGYYYDANTGITTWIPERKTIDFQNAGPITGWQSSNVTPYSASKTDSAETGHDSLGNWYNWTAAIASNDSSSLKVNTYTDVVGNPKNSICPKGWRLPTISSQSASDIGSTNEFARLNYLYNGNKTNTDAGLVVAPIFFRRVGGITGGGSSLSNVGMGFVLSSTVDNSNTSYRLDFRGRSITTSMESVRYEGFSVRCVAR